MSCLLQGWGGGAESSARCDAARRRSRLDAGVEKCCLKMQMMQMVAPSLALGDGEDEDEVVDREIAGTVTRTLSCLCC